MSMAWKLKIPGSLVLAGMTITIRESHTLAAFASEAGHSDLNAMELTLATGLTPQKRRETLLHELLHFINWFWDVKLSESQVKRLAYGLHEALGQLEVELKEDPP